MSTDKPTEFEQAAAEQSSGNITAAARLLDLHPNYLHRLIRNMNLRPLIKKMA